MVQRTFIFGLLLALLGGCGEDSEVVTSPWNLAEPASGLSPATSMGPP
jgi:hypothetical protein